MEFFNLGMAIPADTSFNRQSSELRLPAAHTKFHRQFTRHHPFKWKANGECQDMSSEEWPMGKRHDFSLHFKEDFTPQSARTAARHLSA